MSSHHFVREDQEPALLILHPEAISFSKVQELLEWSPRVIVNYVALPTVQGWGIKVDVVLAPESNKNSLLSAMQEQGPLQWIWTSQNDDEVEMAFHFLLASRQHYVNIVGQLETYRTLTIDWSDRLHITWLENHQRWVWISSGKLDKWLPGGTVYWQVDLKGRQEYVTKTDGLVHLKSEGPFWFVEEL